MLDKQSFINKLSLRIKIILAIFFSLVISFIAFILLQHKENDIPIISLSLLVQLHQNQSGELTLRSVSLQDKYPQDYQLNLESNYYTIELKKADKTIFTGKTVKSYITVIDEFNEKTEVNNMTSKSSDNSSDGQVYYAVENLTSGLNDSGTIDMPLNDFELNLPYFRDAEELVILDENGEEILSTSLREHDLKEPTASKKTCGDGVCSDNENILMCQKDCSYSLEKLFNK